MWIVIIGNPVDGFNYIGPFDDNDKALAYAGNIDTSDWWIAEVEKP